MSPCRRRDPRDQHRHPASQPARAAGEPASPRCVAQELRHGPGRDHRRRQRLAPSRRAPRSTPPSPACVLAERGHPGAGPGAQPRRGAGAGAGRSPSPTPTACPTAAGWRRSCARFAADPGLAILGGDMRVVIDDPGAARPRPRPTTCVYAFRAARSTSPGSRFSVTANLATRRSGARRGRAVRRHRHLRGPRLGPAGARRIGFATGLRRGDASCATRRGARMDALSAQVGPPRHPRLPASTAAGLPRPAPLGR